MRHQINQLINKYRSLLNKGIKIKCKIFKFRRFWTFVVVKAVQKISWNCSIYFRKKFCSFAYDECNIEKGSTVTLSIYCVHLMAMQNRTNKISGFLPIYEYSVYGSNPFCWIHSEDTKDKVYIDSSCILNQLLNQSRSRMKHR